MHDAMRDVSVSSTAASSSRETALTEFGRAAATLPYNAAAVQKALQNVEQQGGKELKVEVCCTVGGFESMTRAVDATLRKKPPNAVVAIMKGVNNIANHSRTVLLASSAIAAVCVAVAVVSWRA